LASPSAIVELRASVSWLDVAPPITCREKTWSIPRSVSRLAVAALLEFCSCTTLAPSYRNLVVAPEIVLLELILAVVEVGAAPREQKDLPEPRVLDASAPRAPPDPNPIVPRTPTSRTRRR
jgi:hypothetical protein